MKNSAQYKFLNKAYDVAIEFRAELFIYPGEELLLVYDYDFKFGETFTSV